jgi:threonine dehydrogenase-like Zn-dependent dehydrogenase
LQPVIDPFPLRRDIAIRYGADYVVDPAAGDVVQAVRMLAPRGVDVAYVTAECYVQGSQDFVELASHIVSVGGTVNVIRMHRAAEVEGLGRNSPAFHKETGVRNLGQYFSRHSLLGGRATGEFGVVIEQLARHKLRADYVTRLQDFSAITTPGQVAALFDSMFSQNFKIGLSFHAG